MNTIIPDMVHPFGKYWEQPDKSKILIDDKHALMSRHTLEELKEYSTTIPTGAYEGKMWKACLYTGNGKEMDWYLRWYDSHPTDLELVQVCSRRIILV